MANIRTIRRRIRSVENTAKITRAMEMIAASKMRRAQERVLAGRPYADKLQSVLGHLAAQSESLEDLHPLLEKREVQNVQILHVTPDRGLTGGLNSNLNRRASQFVLEEKLPVSAVTIGKKGRDFLIRYGQNVTASFTDMGDRFEVPDIQPMTRLITDAYTSGEADRVYLIYAEFVSMVVQRPVVRQLLPIEPEAAADGAAVHASYIYEPDAAGVLRELLPRFVDVQVYQALLEANASEHSARMVAMRNATDSANEMIQGLTLEMNKVRQATITGELLDITGGVVALEG